MQLWDDEWDRIENISHASGPAQIDPAQAQRIVDLLWASQIDSRIVRPKMISFSVSLYDVLFAWVSGSKVVSL